MKKSEKEHSHLFQSIHSPIGANAGFAIGLENAGGGFSLERERVPEQDIYIGYQEGKKLFMLPFYKNAVSKKKDTFVKEDHSNHFYACPFSGGEVEREFLLATDTFRAGKLSFSVMNRVVQLGDLEREEEKHVKEKILPAVIARFCVDNRTGKEDLKAFFGLGDFKGKQFLSQIYEGKRCGILSREGYGFEVRKSSGLIVEEVADFDFITLFGREKPGILMLASMGGLLFHVPAGEKLEADLAFGWYRGGIITEGAHACRYLYTDYYQNLQEVLQEALNHKEQLWMEAEKNNELLNRTSLSEVRKKLLCQSVKSYYISSMLCMEGKKLRWIMNEGSFLMMNTFDLLIDHVFFDLRYHPWTIRNQLSFFLESYSYTDQCGISFTHDMGSHHVFTPSGTSSYEIAGENGCFSYMTQEELCNWILAAAIYTCRTGDRKWLYLQEDAVVKCLRSMQKRSGAIQGGIMGIDSSRCEGGSEITTYDSLDVSLGQARGNTYMAVKCFAAYLALSSMLRWLDKREEAEDAGTSAEICMESILSCYLKEEKRFPALFGEGGEMAILPIVEGIVYPAFFGEEELMQKNGPCKELICALQEHVRTVLKPGICLFEDGGFKLSETSENSWMSKIFLCQYVIEQVLGQAEDQKIREIMDRADQAHWHWWTDGCPSCPGIDQIFAGTQTEEGFHYPRCITSILWLGEE